MYRILLTVCFLLASVQAHAQLSGQAKIDSLLAELPNAKGDTNHVNLLTSLSFKYRSINPDKGIEYGEEAISLSTKLDWEKGLASSHNSLGVNYHNLGNYPKAIEYYKKALEIYEEIGNKRGVCAIIGNMGSIYMYQSDYPKALEYYQKSLKINEEIGSKSGVAINLGNIGVIYEKQFDYSKALEYYQKALKMNEELGDKSGVAFSLVYMAGIFLDQSKYSRTLEYYEKALKIYEELGDKSGVANILGNMGLIYSKQSDYPKALEYYRKALKINEEIGNENAIAYNLGGMGELYLDLSQDSVSISPDELNQYVSLNRNINLNKAIEYSIEAIKIFEEIGDLAIRSYFLKNLADAYKLKGEYEKAYEAHVKHKNLQDSVFNLDKEKEIANLTAVREKEVAEKELVISQLENDQRKQESYVLYGGLALLAVVLFIIFRQRKKSEKLLLNILPVKIAKQLKKRKGNIADDIENASVTFIDLVGFTAYSKDKKASDVLEMLNLIFSRIDKLVIKHGLEKIKTMGDGYMAAAGVPEAQADHPVRITKFAFDVHKVLEESNKENNMNITARIGIECGPLVAGVIGDMKFIYDLWGDSVNTASRMESTGIPSKVHITENFKLELEKHKNGFTFSEPIEMDIKGKGMMKTYYIESKQFSRSEAK